MLIRTNYEELPDGYNNMLVSSASTSEILADKLLAVPARNNIKARDLWDITWLQQQNVDLNIDLLKQKIADHSMSHYKQRLEARINEMPAYFETRHFENELSRFVDSNRLAQTVLKPEFVDYVSLNVLQTLKDVHQWLYSAKKDKPVFTL